MATLTKGEIVDQAFVLMRISGLTIKASPPEIGMALSALERMVLSYENSGLFLSYNKSETYPMPDPSEESGLNDKSIQAIVLLLFKNLCPAFGKMFPLELREEASMAYRGLFSVIAPTRGQNPMQPSGQGNNRYVGDIGFNRKYMPDQKDINVNNDSSLEGLEL